MLSVTSSYDQENLPVVGSGKAFSGLQQARKGGKASVGPSGGSVKQPQRKALGEITNTPRRALGEITNKQEITIPQKSIQKAPLKPASVKTRKPKQKEVKAKVPDVENLYPFKYTPAPDVPGLDFNINSFLVPVMPYSSLEYSLPAPDAGFVPEEFVFDAPLIEDIHVSDIHIGIDDCSLTEDLIIGL